MDHESAYHSAISKTKRFAEHTYDKCIQDNSTFNIGKCLVTRRRKTQ